VLVSVTYPELHTQDVSAVLDAGDVAKLGHCVHTEEPAVVWYFPASQLVQDAEPFVAAYLPATQFWQASANAESGYTEAENLPSRQSVQTVAPSVVTNLPPGQLVQAAKSVVGLYFPVTHCKHSESTNVNPALHEVALQANNSP
jgi:hypothetical protein